ncbi:serine hydrolase domain-containing protein [Micromonospora sp. NBC_01813]|uniref:serine hydrolase domain-containing protein n=1 Tax=Micromonospora sp. NBC_01813 TaxID=2975988 RepID=UPI002DDBDD08|nr:serine hydrolase domain-containing protein [Micromonospora sp. NBC_01813]WSA09228.1 beta-lactamase family protein [Micromonospora sp. NBC_01813]
MRTHLGRLGLTAALAAALVATSAVPVSANRSTGTSRQLQVAVDDLHDLGVTGVQGLTVVGRATSYARAGVGDLDRATPVPINGHFRMGSNTKTFVSVVVLQLVGEGKLSLNDTVERWLPGLVVGNGNDGRQITVRQLLAHTSGIYNYTNDIAALNSYEGYLAHRFDHYDATELVALAMKHEPNFAPGTSWDYSNTNYILAGMIIERVTGRSWPREVRDRILQPLGLRNTSLPGDWPLLPVPHAKGYQQWVVDGALTDTTRFNPSAADAAGNMVTTPSDLASFWQALQRGQLLGPRQMAQLHDTVLAETFQDFIPGARYGLGIMYIPNRCGGYWSHGGDVPGTSTANGVSTNGERVAVLSLTTRLADDRAVAVHGRAFRLMDDVICGPAPARTGQALSR